MKNYIMSIWMILTGVLYVGCHSVLIEELHNHTGKTIVVRTYSLISDNTYSGITNGQIKITGLPYKINDTSVKAGNYTYHHEMEYQFTLENSRSTGLGPAYKFSIEKDNKIWNYNGEWIPSQFYKSVGGHRLLVDFQIEPDGAIYVLSSNMQAPVTNFPAQPPGFPLHPN